MKVRSKDYKKEAHRIIQSHHRAAGVARLDSWNCPIG